MYFLIIGGIFVIAGGIWVLALKTAADLFGVGFALLGGGCSMIWYAFFAMKKFNPSRHHVTFTKKFEIVILTNTIILYLFLLLNYRNSVDNFSADAGFNIWILALVGVIVVGSIGYAKKKKMTLYELYTLQAKDEREQILIDHAGRKAYALMRLILPFFGILVMTGVFGSSLSSNRAFQLLIMLTFLGELFFRVYARSIEGNS